MTKEDPFRDGRCYKILCSVVEELPRMIPAAATIISRTISKDEPSPVHIHKSSGS